MEVKPQIKKEENDQDDEFTEILDLPNPDAFDLTSYITEGLSTGQPPTTTNTTATDNGKSQGHTASDSFPQNVVERKRKAPVKKIDMKAHRYDEKMAKFHSRLFFHFLLVF